MNRETGLRLELFVEDMEESIAFYSRVLAFDIERHEPGDYASLRLGFVSKLPEEGGYFRRDISTYRRGSGGGDHPRDGRRGEVARARRCLRPPDRGAPPGPALGTQGL